MTDTDLASLSASTLRRMIGEREVSPVEVTAAHLARIDRYNGVLNAVVTVSERAMDDARQLEDAQMAGELLPLHGLPVGIKDVTPVAGLKTTFGSTLFADHVPDEDALVVSRLKRAGAVIVGKTNCPEFAAGGNTLNDVFGATRNPWNTDLSAGGSTGGGAAGLVSGMICLAEGTDLGGSLRIPAAFCGVTGLRPSPGLVPTHPSHFSWDNLNVTGPMARNAGDVALMLQAVSGPSPTSPVVQPTEGRDFVAGAEAGVKPGTRVAYCRDIAGIGVDEEIEHVCRKAVKELETAGVHSEEIDLDLSYGWEPFLTLRGLWFVSELGHLVDRMDELGVNVRNNLEAGLAVTTQQLGEAGRARTRIWHFFRDFFGRFDHLLTPSVAVSPFPAEQNYPERVGDRKMKTYVDWIAPTFILSLSGLPVASVPCGKDPRGLPVGLQVVGPPLGEEKVLGLASEIERLHPLGPAPLP